MEWQKRPIRKTLQALELTDHLLGIGRTENEIARHQNIGTTLSKFRCILLIDTAINFNQGFGRPLLNQALQIVHFMVGLLDKFLTAKSWVDRHQTDQVNVLNNIFKNRNGRMGIDRYTSLGAQAFDLLNIAMEMAACFSMNGDDLRSRFPKFLYVQLGSHHHQVNI